VPRQLAGILFCLLLAYVANYGLEQWLEDGLIIWTPPTAVVDGSTLNTTQYYLGQTDTVLALRPDQEALLDFYAYLDQGGADNYQQWQISVSELRAVGTAFMAQALAQAEMTATVKFLSLLLLILTLLLRFGQGLRENYWFTPLLCLGVVAGTAALYGGLAAPFATGLLIGIVVLYFGGIRLFLPIYHSEWSRIIRPVLTLCVFILAVMSWRGQELVDYWFWTSPLFRFLLVVVVLLMLFFHLSILSRVLKKAKIDSAARIFAYGMPLGITALVTGLTVGLYGDQTGAGLQRLNYELLPLGPDTVAAFSDGAPFTLFFAGVALLIIGGIGYFIQRIAR
jgi:fumarate reductase subunit D